MSYLTLEVEIDRGYVVAKEPGRLPEKGIGLLTILSSEGEREVNPIEALEVLQKHLSMDEQRAEQWMQDVRDARR